MTIFRTNTLNPTLSYLRVMVAYLTYGEGRGSKLNIIRGSRLNGLRGVKGLMVGSRAKLLLMVILSAVEVNLSRVYITSQISLAPTRTHTNDALGVGATSINTSGSPTS